jgi:hypothetical protein
MVSSVVRLKSLCIRFFEESSHRLHRFHKGGSTSLSMAVSSNPQKPLRAVVDAFLSEICVICGHLCFLKCKDLLDELH